MKKKQGCELCSYTGFAWGNIPCACTERSTENINIIGSNVSLKSVERQLRNKFEEWAGSFKNQGTRDILREYCFIAGGSIASLILGEEPNDYDIFCTRRSVAGTLYGFYEKMWKGAPYKYARSMYGIGSIKVIQSQSCQVKSVSPAAITLEDDIQIILMHIGHPRDVIATFDFIHCSGFWTYKDGLVLPSNVRHAIENRRLIPNLSTKSQVRPIARLRKFLSRGWEISRDDLIEFIKLIDK